MATKIQLPYLEDTGLDGKKLYTPECTERFRHYIKRIHNIDIKQILTDDTVPTSDPWDTKKTQKSDKISSGAPDRRQSRLSQKVKLTRTLTQSKPIN